MNKLYLNIIVILIAFLLLGLFIYSRVKDASTIIEARRYQNKGNYEKSAELYLKALKETPNNFNFYKELAHIYKHTGDNQKLKKIFNDGLKVNPDDKYFLINAGWMNFKDKKFAEAEKQFEKVFNKDKKNANIAFMYARTLQEEGKFREALEIFQIALNNGFAPKRCHLNMAAIYECGFNDYKKAIEYYNLYLEESNKKDKKIEEKIKDFTQWSIGEKLEAEGKYAEAITEYNKQLSSGNTSIAVYSRLGRAYRKNCNFLTGESIYVKALAKYDNNYYILNNLGSLYFTIERNKDALSCWLDAIKKDPEKPNAYYNLGTLNTKLENFDKAEEYYLKALTKGYDRADVYIQLYQMATKYMKNREKAIKYAYVVREYPQYTNALLPIDRTEPIIRAENINTENEENKEKNAETPTTNNIEENIKNSKEDTTNNLESTKNSTEQTEIEKESKSEKENTNIEEPIPVETPTTNITDQQIKEKENTNIEPKTEESKEKIETKSEPNKIEAQKTPLEVNDKKEETKTKDVIKKEETKKVKEQEPKKEVKNNKIDSDNEIPAFSAPPI